MDTHPWHRQFWPWFLILLPACVVVASIYSAWIASRGADDLVADDYYRDGLAINRQLEKQQRAQALGISARLQFNADTVTVTTTGLLDTAELHLVLSHPMEADRDFTVVLEQVGPHAYTGSLKQPIAPHWHWALEAQGEHGWRIDGDVQPAEIDDAHSD